jgi:hypothetical protein
MMAALNWIYINRNYIDGMVHTGDFMDAKSVSLHDLQKEMSPEINLGEEYRANSEILDLHDEALGDTDGKSKKKVFIYGNHEDRFQRYMNKLGNARLLGAITDIDQGLQLRERGYQILRNWNHDFFELGDYKLIHGTYTTKYAFNKTIEMYTSNVLFGHTHRYGTGYTMGYKGLNVGWMGDKDHPFFSYTSYGAKQLWINAITTIDVIDGICYPQVHFWNEKYQYLVVEGKIYRP